MASPALTNYMTRRMCEIHSPFYCKLNNALLNYMESSELLKACGHDTADLDEAIKETMNSIIRLKAVNEAAESKFKKEGVIIYTDKSKLIEAELESLT